MYSVNHSVTVFRKSTVVMSYRSFDRSVSGLASVLPPVCIGCVVYSKLRVVGWVCVLIKKWGSVYEACMLCKLCFLHKLNFLNAP